jgi:hypothetical protein
MDTRGRAAPAPAGAAGASRVSAARRAATTLSVR